MKNQETPKNIRQAIKNGLCDCQVSNSRQGTAEAIEKHVLDFLSQKFAYMTLNDNPEIVRVGQELWNNIESKE